MKDLKLLLTPFALFALCFAILVIQCIVFSSVWYKNLSRRISHQLEKSISIWLLAFEWGPFIRDATAIFEKFPLKRTSSAGNPNLCRQMLSFLVVQCPRCLYTIPRTSFKYVYLQTFTDVYIHRTPPPRPRSCSLTRYTFSLKCERLLWKTLWFFCFLVVSASLVHSCFNDLRLKRCWERPVNL